LVFPQLINQIAIDLHVSSKSHIFFFHS